MADHAKDKRRKEKTATLPRRSESAKVQRRADSETPYPTTRPASQLRTADEQPRFYSTGMMPGQFSSGLQRGFRPGSPVEIPPNVILSNSISVVVCEALLKFPEQPRQSLALSRHLISELTPLLIAGMNAGLMKKSVVLDKAEHLLRSLFNELPIETNEVLRNVKRTDEWQLLAKAVATSKRPVRTVDTIKRVGRPRTADAQYERAKELSDSGKTSPRAAISI